MFPHHCPLDLVSPNGAPETRLELDDKLESVDSDTKPAFSDSPKAVKCASG